jgi:hypothetical protein
MRSGESWNHLISELTPESNSTGDENKKNNRLVEVVWDLIFCEVQFLSLANGGNLIVREKMHIVYLTYTPLEINLCQIVVETRKLQ